jgi:hypothetical protein
MVKPPSRVDLRVATTSTTTCTSVASTLTAQEEREARGSESVVVSQRHQIITIPRERARKAVEGDVTIPRERANPRPVSLFLRSNGVPVPAQNLEVTAQQQNTAASWNHLDSLLLRIKPPHRNAWLSHVSSNHENSSVASTHTEIQRFQPPFISFLIAACPAREEEDRAGSVAS